MGVESRRAPPLPAPTETDSTTGGTELDSRITEKSAISLPEDGSPVTIATRRKRHERDTQDGLSSNKSQTSLLIEYFEGGKNSQSESRRPSVRVKVTPSSKSRSRSTNDHIQITERKGTRRPSYTKRIQLSPHQKSLEGDGDDNSQHSYHSATEESNVTSRGGGPIEVEIMPRRHGSPLIPTGENSSNYVQQNMSDVSSMPADSFLDGKTRSPERKRSRSLTRGEVLAAGAVTGLVAGAVVDKLKAPSRERSRSLSRERIVAQKAVEKVRGDKSERRRKHSSRSRSVSAEQNAEGVKSPRRRSSRGHHEDAMVSGGDSSLLTSQVSRKSGDHYSFRSGTSKSSINNPKLLETVEDAIRRLILPELTALKREQSKHAHRERERRGSITSGSGVSKGSREEFESTRKVSDRGSGANVLSKPRVTLNDGEVLSGSSGKRVKDKNIDSRPSFERETSEETAIRDGDRLHKKRSSDRNRGLEAAAIGVGVGALTAAALHKHQSQDSLDERKERRRRRTKSRSRSDSMAESYEERERDAAPPMPLMSDFNASEITRTSILSADTERPHSASEERVTPIREVPRGVASPSMHTPTRTTGVGLHDALRTQHLDYSRGSLSPHSQHSQHSEPQLRAQETVLDEERRNLPMHASHEQEHEDELVEEGRKKGHSHALAAGLAGAAVGAIAGAALAGRHHDDEHDDYHDDPDLRGDEDDYYDQNRLGVPQPLRYVPYGQERRALSPIQSVSGYTEGDLDHQQRDSRLTQSTGSYSSLNKSNQRKQSGRSSKSLDSAGILIGNRHDFTDVRHGGLTDSELTQDGEYWEEQHRENDRNRDFDSASYRSSDPRIDYKHATNYTDDGMDSPEFDHVAAGQNVRGIGANPAYVHTPLGVESAVASLVNASDLTGQNDRRGSYASFDDGSERHFASRGNSPTKRDIQRDLTYDGSDRGTSSQRNSPTKYAEEYELDEHGRKVTMPKYNNSHRAEKAVIAGIAAGAAAAVLAKARNQKSDADQIHYEERSEDTGAPLHKSFKERAMEGQGQIPSPRHSVDAISDMSSREQLKMGASGLPDLHDPLPEIGYGDGDSEVTTNPSIIQGPIGGVQQGSRDHWPGHPTPPQAQVDTVTTDLDEKDHSRDHSNLKAAAAALAGAAVGAGAAAAIAGHNRDGSHDQDEEWQRTSGDRKRDTLVTNPYEGTSPIAAIGLDRDLLGQSGFQDLNHEFGPSKLGYQTGSPGAIPKDEGYISSAPNARSPGAITPEPRMKGVGFLDQDLGGGADSVNGDPFYTPKHSRHLSGMSHGMGSPMYDSTTGNGLDRIRSKDIVALMDHLTVRDAQRSARDTELLVTLVRAAAEMRNSFEDMKRLLADTEDVIITEVQGNTEKTIQRAINGPRPQPASGSRSIRQGSQDETLEDLPTKRTNVFRRALKGLSMRSSNDLGKIEDMLVQLLGEVEGLKVAQGLKPISIQPGASYDDLQQEGNYEHDRGYEPEGNAGTSTASHASQSGHLSLPMSRGTSATKGFERKFSDHRISTVPEGDEDELDPRDHAILSDRFENNGIFNPPAREIARGGSAPLETPPQQYVAPASLSNENTPRTDKSKKRKSGSSSSWIPKVSRWSGTTASTVLKGFRTSGRNVARKGDDQFEEPPSRSGSDIANYAEHDPYGDDKLHSGFSQEQLRQYNENERPEPVLEDPKYKAHRNSLNLQHPQPRPGPTHRHQTALESQAQHFNSPKSPRSLDWGSQSSLNRLPPQQVNRYSNGSNNTGNLSPISDGSYSHGAVENQVPVNQGLAPARPPKEPIAPDRPPKVYTSKLQKPSPLSNEHLIPTNDTYKTISGAFEPEVSPRPAVRALSGAMGGVPMRKPTGPRSMSSASKSGGDLNRDDVTPKRNKNRDTFGTVASNESGESETF